MSDPMDYDAELRLHNEVLRRACDIRRHDRVLDIGCGAGQTTRDAARIAAAGNAVGVDISAGMIARAQVLTDAEGLRNVRFEQADAQVHRFPSEHFDVVISRFGTMFFADPIAAFSNIRRALRSEGRLVMMVWQRPRIERVVSFDSAGPRAARFGAYSPSGSARPVLACRFDHGRADPQRGRMLVLDDPR